MSIVSFEEREICRKLNHAVHRERGGENWLNRRKRRERRGGKWERGTQRAGGCSALRE
jgi:hypothetical protein